MTALHNSADITARACYPQPRVSAQSSHLTLSGTAAAILNQGCVCAPRPATKGTVEVPSLLSCLGVLPLFSAKGALTLSPCPLQPRMRLESPVSCAIWECCRSSQSEGAVPAICNTNALQTNRVLRVELPGELPTCWEDLTPSKTRSRLSPAVREHAPSQYEKRPHTPSRTYVRRLGPCFKTGRMEPFSQRRCVREMLQLPNSAERGNPLWGQNPATRNTATRERPGLRGQLRIARVLGGRRRHTANPRTKTPSRLVS